MIKEKDWMGLWYKIMKERGENDEPTFGSFDLKSKEITWTKFSHMDMDGVGVIYDIYEKKGIQLENYPQLQEKSFPNFLEKIQIFLNLFLNKKKITPIWKENNIGLKPSDNHAIEFFILDVLETKKIEEYCKRNRLSICALLMNISTNILLKELSINQSGTWTLPVNLRPILKKTNFKANHSSGVLVPIKINDPVSKTHNIIKESLNRKEHWGIWWVHQIGRIIGYQGMKYLSKRSADKNYLIGSFSYLSKWDLPENDIFIGGPPGSKNFPISIMVMIANNHLSFSIKIHPYILRDQSKVRELLHEIQNNILKTID